MAFNYIVLVCDCCLYYNTVFVLLLLMFINVIILPSNEALVYGSHWALANLLYWYGRMTGRMVRSMVGSDARTKIAIEARAGHCSLPACRAPRSMVTKSRRSIGHDVACESSERIRPIGRSCSATLSLGHGRMTGSLGVSYVWRC